MRNDERRHSGLRLHFVRHGETAESREHRFCGEFDCELTPEGRRMAEAVAERVVTTGAWEAVYSSPLRRAVMTASPAAERIGLPVRLETGLREISHGAWEGKLDEEVAALDPTGWERYQLHPGLEGAPGGESGYAVAARALPVIDGIRHRHPSGDVLIVSHKATIRIVVCALIGLDIDLYRIRLAQPVASFTVVEQTGQGWMLRLLADTRISRPIW